MKDIHSIQTLDRLRPGESATVVDMEVGGSMRRRFLDIGLIPNTRVECVGRSPAGDPSAYLICGALIAIRARDCRGIRVSRNEEVDTSWV